MSWSFKGSEGNGGKGGNKPDGGGSPPNPLALLSGNLGKAGSPGKTPPGETPGELLPPPDGPPKEEPKSWAAAADTGGRPGILGILNPGGKTGVIPAMGLLAIAPSVELGTPFFSASSINCNNGG